MSAEQEEIVHREFKAYVKFRMFFCHGGATVPVGRSVGRSVCVSVGLSLKTRSVRLMAIGLVVIVGSFVGVSVGIYNLGNVSAYKTNSISIR